MAAGIVDNKIAAGETFVSPVAHSRLSRSHKYILCVNELNVNYYLVWKDKG